MRTHRTVVAGLLVAGALTAQATTWTSFQDRRGHAMASTPVGGVVMFGGERVTQPGTRLADTHRLSSGNQSWNRVPNAPVGRSGHGMAGIMVGGQPKYVVFGGLTGNGQPSADTWVYDGSSWDPRGQGGPAPTARTAHGMVAGQLGGAFGGIPRVWLFGGFNGGELSDLWSYQPDFDQWNLLGSIAGQPVGTWPASRSAHALAFVPGLNPGDERIYLFGGRTGISGFNNDLWSFDPNLNTWQRLLPPTPAPTPRRDAAMAFVPGIGGLVLFGGRSSSSSGLGDTWVYDPSANTWTERTFAVSPPGRSGHAVSVDATGDRLVLLGGTDAAGQPASGTWFFDTLAPGSPPGAWIEQFPVPTPRSGAAFAFDSNPSRQRHVMFGGYSPSLLSVVDETWELNGIDWTRRTPSAKPSARTESGMVYHVARDRMVLYGGRGPGGVELSDTWEWNGSGWSIPSLTGSPPAAGGIQMVYDTARNRILMPVAGASAMETWILSGSSWSALPLVVQPPIRTNYGCAYDTRRDLVVMFGGMSSNSRSGAIYNNETWIFDGTAWVRRFPESSPSPRGWCKLAYDESRSRVVLFGGADAFNVFDETWEWDGSNWIQELPAAVPLSPNANLGHGLSYDPKRALTVAQGVFGTWDYGPVVPADVTSYGVGCTTSASATLNLKQLGWSRLWLGERLELDIEGAPAASLGLMLWGLSGTELVPGVPLPLDLRLVGFSTGPCFLSTSADLATEAVFPPTTRYMSFPMPVDPFLLGLEAYLQMAYFDAPANPSNPPAVTSNALKMKLGQKASVFAPAFEPNQALNMVRIEGESFQMGSAAVGGTAVPARQVTITQPFWIGKHEVTQASYSALMGTNGSFHLGAAYPDAPERPVERVSWHEAMDYCAALTAQESAAGRVPVGYQFRLPTEAEWEFVCRAGSTTDWNTGTTLDQSHANFGGATAQTARVAVYPPNAWGLFDMHGNVWEWVLDAYAGANYGTQTNVDPLWVSGSRRIHRGGGYSDPGADCRSALRNASQPSSRSSDVGFRIVLAPIKVFYPESSLGMLAIPSGTFQMGSAVVGGTAVPVHSVTISTPFWMARHEVTQAQFQALMGSNPSSFQGPGHPDAPSRPVERVTWAEAVAYCSALTAQEAAAGRVPVGYQYRLPTEAEWEYCCRASTTTEWSTGSSLTAAQANIENVIARTVACGSYGSNPWGLFDMHGNVWEWCLDSWDGTANYSSGAVSDPYVTTGHVKLHRGGGYARIANDCRSALRNASPSTNRSSDIGFRIVLAPVLVP